MQFEERSDDNFSRDMVQTRNDLNTVIKMHPSIEKSLNNIIVREGLISYKVFTRMISTKGGNYFGQLYEVDISGVKNQEHKEIYIFLKHTIPGEHIKEIVNVDNMFLNEVFVYKELGKMFNTLQESAQIPEDKMFKLVKNYDESNNNAILLENLTKKGFKTLNRMNVVPIKFAEISIQQLAKFHALSFVLRYKTKSLFENKIGAIKPSQPFGESWRNFVKHMINFSTRYFESDILVQERIEKFMYVLWKKQPKYLTGDTKSVRCLCHGDFRISNLLFKESDEENIEVAIVDYQLIFYGSPVTDILYFFYTSTDRNFREAHMADLKNLYYTTLTYFLKYFNLDGNSVYPRHVFEKDFKDYHDYGLMIGLSILPFCLAREDEVLNISNDQIEDMITKLDDRYKVRLTEIVEEYLDLGIL